MKRGIALAVAALVSTVVATAAFAEDIVTRGTGSADVRGHDPKSVRALATAEAKRRAVIAAIERVLGAGAAATPQVASKIDAIVEQISDSQITQTTGQTVDGRYEVSVSLALDDKAFRSLLSDSGIALNTARARSQSILVVIDEYVTTPRDLKAPLADLEVYRRRAGSDVTDNVDARQSDSASARSAFSDREHSSGGHVVADDSGVAAGGHREGSDVRGSDSASAKSAASYKERFAASEHDNVDYAHLVLYQPQATAPQKISMTDNAFKGQLQDYDLRVLDNDVFRSRYFAGKPLTLQELADGPALAHYVDYARTDAKADFFLAGTAVIVDSGASSTTGEAVCTGLLSVKTYSTSTGEDIGADTFSETAAGLNANDCAGNLAKKMAAIGGPIIAARIQTYHKRGVMYGRELTLTLVGHLPLVSRTRFFQALSALPGVSNVDRRSSDGDESEFTVTYAGSQPIDEALAAALADDPAFANLDSHTEGGKVVLCLGACAAAHR